MLQSIDIFSFILAFIVIYFSIQFLSKVRQKEIFRAKLEDLVKYKQRLIQEEAQEKKIYKISKLPNFPWLRNFVDKIQRMGVKQKEEIKKSFMKAGFNDENAVIMYSLAKILFLFSFCIIAFIILYFYVHLNVLYETCIFLFSGLLGSYSVDKVLSYLVNKRQQKIRKAFPEALDLMVICAEAGLSLTATVKRVAREVSQVAPDLGYELALLSIELDIFSDRKRAFNNFNERLDSPYFRAILTNIVQAEQYGTPMAQTMRTVSDEFRKDRLLEAEERAAKLPVLLSLPMMLLIFPCIYIVVMGPAIIKVLEVVPRHQIIKK